MVLRYEYQLKSVFGNVVIALFTKWGYHLVNSSGINHVTVVQSPSYTCLFATPWTVALQAPLSIGFPRQEKDWMGLPFPSPGNLSNPGTEPHLLLDRQILCHWAIWEAHEHISKNLQKVSFFQLFVCVCVCTRECMLSHFTHVWLFVTLCLVVRQAPLGYFRQEYWRELPCPPPGDLVFISLLQTTYG